MNHSNEVTCRVFSSYAATNLATTNLRFSFRKREFLEVAVNPDGVCYAYIIMSFSGLENSSDYPRNATFEEVLEYIERVLDRNAFL